MSAAPGVHGLALFSRIFFAWRGLGLGGRGYLVRALGLAAFEHDGPELAALNLEDLPCLQGGQYLGIFSGAGAQRLGLAGAAKTGYDDLSPIDDGAGVVVLYEHGKVGAVYADGRYRGVEPEILAGAFGTSPGNGPQHAGLKLEPYAGFSGCSGSYW